MANHTNNTNNLFLFFLSSGIDTNYNLAENIQSAAICQQKKIFTSQQGFVANWSSLNNVAQKKILLTRKQTLSKSTSQKKKN